MAGLDRSQSNFHTISATSSLPPPPTPLKRRAQSAGPREAGSLLTEPSLGQDTVYDGAAEMNSIAARCRPRTPKYAGLQAHNSCGSAFNSKVYKAHQRPMSREQVLVPNFGDSGGPLHYKPYGEHNMSAGDGSEHALSGSIIWFSRGRTGPIGTPFDSRRRHPVFSSNVPPRHFTAKPPPGRTCSRAVSMKEDCFVLKPDFFKDMERQREFRDTLQQRVEYGRLPLAPVISAPTF
jgi:hypothetical protein